MPFIQVSIADRVAELVLDRPEKLNAMHGQMLAEFDAALRELRESPDVSVVLLRGNGRAFSVGYDLLDNIEQPGAGTYAVAHDLAQMVELTNRWLEVWDFPKPIVAAVHGHCLAGAAFLVSMTDVTVVAEDLQVGWAKLPLGGGWLSPVFTHLVGMKRASELSTLRGSTMSGREAVDLGWANSAVPADQLLDAARDLAVQTARVPLELLVLNKRAIHRTMEAMGFRQAITAGVEIDAIAHFTPGATALRGELTARGVKEAIQWFDTGGAVGNAAAAPGTDT